MRVKHLLTLMVPWGHDALGSAFGHSERTKRSLQDKKFRLGNSGLSLLT